MDHPSDAVWTEMINLTGATIEELRRLDEADLKPYVGRLLRQVERVRYNLGTGPPGRVD